MQSIEYFACARSIFFEVGYMDTQVFRCKVLNTLHVQEVFLKLSSLKYFLHVHSIQYFPCATSISEAIQFNKNTSCICKVFNTLYMLQVFLGLVFSINTFVTCKVSNTLQKYLFEFYKFAYPHTIWEQEISRKVSDDKIEYMKQFILQVTAS